MRQASDLSATFPHLSLSGPQTTQCGLTTTVWHPRPPRCPRLRPPHPCPSSSAATRPAPWITVETGARTRSPGSSPCA